METKLDSQDDTYSTDNIEQVEMDMDKSEDDADQKSNSSERIVDNNNDRRLNDYKNDTREIRKIDTKEYTNIVQISNIAPSATLEQLAALLNYVGDIMNIELYQSDSNPEFNFKVCFVEFAKSSSVSLAQHLTNTVFIDRALIVLPYYKREIPDRETALSNIADSKYATSFNCGVVSQVMSGVGGAQVIATVDPRLTALGLPHYPQLPVNTDPSRIEEIRRTVYIGNLDSTIPPDQVLKFFNDIGEVKYIRMAGDDTQPTRFAFVEFTNQSSVANALQHNGFALGSRPLKINHSNNAIVKPQPKIETEDSSKRMQDNHSATREISSRDRHHSSRYDRDRERIRDRDRYRDRRLSPRDSKSRRSRSKDRDSSSRRKSRDRILRRSRSRDKSSRRRSRSRDSRRRRSKSSSREHSRSRHHKSSRR